MTGAETVLTYPNTLVQNVFHRRSRIPHIGELNNSDVCLEERGEPHRHWNNVRQLIAELLPHEMTHLR